MKAHFYFLSKSFAHNESFSQTEIEEKIKKLHNDVVLMKQFDDENVLYINYDEIYPCILYATYTMEDIICRGHALKLNKKIERDVYNALFTILSKSKSTDMSFQSVVNDLLPASNSNDTYGIIAFHEIENIDVEEYQLIYGKDEWYRFRRHFLGQFPQDANFFITECKKYFPKLFFHDRNIETINKILHDCPKKIIFNLQALNDNFDKYKNIKINRSEVLKQFSSGEQLDATLQGDPSRKPCFTFKFTDKNAKTRDVCCEPHCKLRTNDRDESFSNGRRIYFHEGFSDFADGRILIGHIGVHL